jgi:hypothetical protein
VISCCLPNIIKAFYHLSQDIISEVSIKALPKRFMISSFHKG